MVPTWLLTFFSPENSSSQPEPDPEKSRFNPDPEKSRSELKHPDDSGSWHGSPEPESFSSEVKLMKICWENYKMDL